MTQGGTALQEETRYTSTTEVGLQVIQEKKIKEINSFEINLGKGASLETIKSEIKNLGCRFNILLKKYTCPIGKKDCVSKLFESNNITSSFKDISDVFFEKKPNEQFADKIWVKEDILTTKCEEEEKRILKDEHFLDEEIRIRGFSEDDPIVIDRRKKIAGRKKNQKELKEEIDQIRNSALLLERQKNKREDQHLDNLNQGVIPIDLIKDSLLEVEIKAGEIHEMTNKAEEILTNSNSGIYQRAGQVVRIVTEKTKPNETKKNKEGNPIIKRSDDALLITEANSTHLCELLSKLAKWTKFDERTGVLKQKDCPDKVALTLIARKQWNLPVLAGIIQAPTLREDGSILEKPGYDEETGLFFNPGKTKFPPIPESPSKEDAISALGILLNLLKDFTFENEESMSVAVSAILTGVQRKSLRTAPLHAFTAPKMGSGKSLLADVVGLISTGKPNSVIPHADNEAEEKKRLLAVLSEGDPIICYDNIERPFGSPALCSVLTQETFKDRLLGVNRSLSVPTNATFLATGNNLTFDGDTSTRVVLCRLDPQCERPEERLFEIDLKKYIPENRGELVRAALTILRAYYIAGRPLQNIPQFGRFEDWSNVVRSALVWLGMEDPCKSRKDIENDDPIRVSLGSLLSAWHETFHDMSMLAKRVIEKAKDHPDLTEVFKEIAQNEKGDVCPRKLGKYLFAHNKRIEGGFRIEKMPKRQNADTWRVVKI